MTSIQVERHWEAMKIDTLTDKRVVASDKKRNSSESHTNAILFLKEIMMNHNFRVSKSKLPGSVARSVALKLTLTTSRVYLRERLESDVTIIVTANCWLYCLLLSRYVATITACQLQVLL
ncbi:CLUMA_CG011237, isoform A [Clunio marinus]|uniref:CLUMA_CG011237, isoform A n=1 Tax=Clunio marinus TaxID=568069 RepID=A0A1J1IFQ5_9DIPT|nr:CLUMA_CG011237, isoform A [Clunio marinus]